MSILRKLAKYFLVFAVTLSFSTVYAGDIFTRPTKLNLPVGDFAQDELIVKFKSGASPLRQVEILRQYDLSIVHQPLGGSWLRLRTPAKLAVGDLFSRLSQLPEIDYVEPNYKVYAQFVPNDTYYSYQWNFDQLNMESAWDVSSGQNVVVAVIDTGVAYENYGASYRQAPDLAGTTFVPGYDFVNNDSHPNDDEGHGTHVAGTVAQTTNNNLGVAGVAYGARIMPVKVLDSNGSGYTTDVAAGITWAADNGAQVINLSLGSSSYSQTLAEAVAYAANQGVVIVAAAGNDGVNGVIYPAALDDYVIAVGAVRYDEQKTGYSNYGSSLDVMAPGGDLSVDQNGDGYGDGILQQTITQNWRRANPRSFGYYFYEGTSMATPHVAGLSALLIANGLAPVDVRTAIEETARDKGTPGRDDYYGWGIVDATAALAWSAVPNTPPVAEAGGPYSGEEDEVIYFDGSGSYDLDGDSLTYSWDFGDGNNGSGVSPSHSYSAGGVYTVTLTVSDGRDSDSDTASVSITEVNDPPVAVAGDDITVIVGETVNFNASGSYDSDGTIVSYDWNFGDSGSDSGVQVAHSYSSVGVYTVTLTVTDNGGLTDEDTLQVTVQEEPTSPTLEVISQTTDSSGNSQTTFTRWDRVYLLTNVSSDSSPVAGANIEIKAYRPNGSLYKTWTGSTDSQGEYFKNLGRFRTSGTWGIEVTAAKAGYETGWHQTSFVIQ